MRNDYAFLHTDKSGYDVIRAVEGKSIGKIAGEHISVSEGLGGACLAAGT